MGQPMNLDQIKSLLLQKNICVLATVSGSRPHCSLMAYITDDSGREVYMVTLRNTRKYANLMDNPAVSLLIDSRGESDRSLTRALTVSGTFDPVDDAGQRGAIKQTFLSTHPHLAELIDHPDAELVRVRIESYLLLDGPGKAYCVEAQR